MKNLEDFTNFFEKTGKKNLNGKFSEPKDLFIKGYSTKVVFNQLGDRL